MVGVWETSKNQLSLRGIVIAAGCLPSHIFFNTSNPSSVFMNARLSTRPVKSQQQKPLHQTLFPIEQMHA